MGKSTLNSNALKDPGFQDSLELDPIPQSGQCPQPETMSPELAPTLAAPHINTAFHLQQYIIIHINQCIFLLIKRYL